MDRAALPDFRAETAARAAGAVYVAGVDEVGRGPLAGPVMAAAVILDPDRLPEGLNDSKRIGRARRQVLAEQIASACAVGVGAATVEEIDALNILRASQLAMCRALAALPRAPDLALIDGPVLLRDLVCAGQAIVGGDRRSLSIAAASIVAKVRRDAHMMALAQQFPGYGWEKNAGYPTRAHLAALRDLGATPHHRRSFAPVRNILYQERSTKP